MLIWPYCKIPRWWQHCFFFWTSKGWNAFGFMCIWPGLLPLYSTEVLSQGLLWDCTERLRMGHNKLLYCWMLLPTCSTALDKGTIVICLFISEMLLGSITLLQCDSLHNFHDFLTSFSFTRMFQLSLQCTKFAFKYIKNYLLLGLIPWPCWEG